MPLRSCLIISIAISTCLTLEQTAAAEDFVVPEMVDLPGGTFLMGSDTGDPDEGPVREVTVEAFSIGRYEVKVSEFRAFAEASGLSQMMGCRYYDGAQRLADTGRSWDAPGFEQSGDHPVVCVSWDEARAYAAWLSEKTGETYRLPSEAEWEYAARAGDQSETRWQAPSEACRYANVSDRTRVAAVKSGTFGASTDDPPSAFSAFPCSDNHIFTAPVGQFPANAFGLYDTIGNAWEMTMGCFKYADLDDGTPSNFCLRRAPRGGSWLLGEGYHRYANRSSIQHDHRNFSIGFRLAKSASR